MERPPFPGSARRAIVLIFGVALSLGVSPLARAAEGEGWLRDWLICGPFQTAGFSMVAPFFETTFQPNAYEKYEAEGAPDRRWEVTWRPYHSPTDEVDFDLPETFVGRPRLDWPPGWPRSAYAHLYLLSVPAGGWPRDRPLDAGVSSWCPFRCSGPGCGSSTCSARSGRWKRKAGSWRFRWPRIRFTCGTERRRVSERKENTMSEAARILVIQRSGSVAYPFVGVSSQRADSGEVLRTASTTARTGFAPLSARASAPRPKEETGKNP